MKTSFEGLGWKVKLQQRGRQFFFSLVREIAVGTGLKKGDHVYYYLVNCNGRKAILTFLDGEERPKDEMVKLRGVGFMVKS